MPDSRTWKRRYEAAILELNPIRVEQLVRDAETAITLRMYEIKKDPSTTGERTEIATAVAGLLEVRISKLGWPDPRTSTAQQNKISVVR